MSDFFQRWQRIARAAGRVEPPSLPAAPLAPGGRWLPTRAGHVPAAEAGLETAEWWRWYGARGLAVATAVLVACLVVVSRDLRERPSLRPGVEDAVAEVLWRL